MKEIDEHETADRIPRRHRARAEPGSLFGLTRPDPADGHTDGGVHGEIDAAADGPEPVQGVVKDVQITECPTTKGEVTAKGKAKNSAKEARDLSVIVIWLKNNSGDPLGSGIAVLKGVPAGKTVDWSVKAKVVDQADRCVLNAQAGQLQASASPSPTRTK